MANITARVQRRLAEHLAPGETVVAALLVEPKHTYGIGALATVVAPRSATRALADQATERNASEGGLARAFPGQACVIVKTSTRILVSVSNGLTFAAPSLTLPRDGLVISEHRRKLLGHRLTLRFADTSAVIVDAQWGQPFDAFK